VGLLLRDRPLGALTLKSAHGTAYSPETIAEADALRRELQQISDILLIRLRSLGDAILTLPLIDALHHWRPELKQSILVEAPYAPVFLYHPAVHETLILQTGKGHDRAGWTRFRAFMELRNRRFPAVLNLHGGTTSMLFMLASGAQLRLGQEGHRASRIYTHRVPPSKDIWNRQSLHTVEHQLSLMQWLGLPIAVQDCVLHVSGAARTRIQARLQSASLSEFFLIQPTATLPTKRWEPKNFAELGDRLRARHGIRIIYTAARHESAVLEEIARVSRECHIYWADLPLDELFALIERCRIFIGCDSGPMHAAAALKKPVVVVWGSSNFQAWHPWGTDYEAVRSELPCMPCPGYTCAAFGEPKCITGIPVSRVAEACERLLLRNGDAPPFPRT
jgi:heptosyltransferase III